ncbi:MAG: single-stranded DNA-binding protein [Deferribacterales bacterium]|nr:single-stranded DNA-binding protein [Deferribacterales bacterium]
MASYNKVVLLGNVTRNPDVRSIPGSGTTVARTGLAVNHRFKDKEDVMFIDITAFGRNAEILGEFVTKGSPILVDGRLSMSSWEQDGVKRTRHEVIVESFQMLGSRKDRTENPGNSMDDGNSAPSASSSPGGELDDDDIPF